MGIAGGSGAGKTTLVKRLLQEFTDVGAALVEQDCYYLDRSKVPFSQRAALNYDHPDAIDADLLVEQVSALKAGRDVMSPIYDFATHTRSGHRVVKAAPLIIVEGILTLHIPGVRQLLDISVFVEHQEGERLKRRIERDVRERGRTVKSVMRQFHHTVKPMHDLYVEPSRNYARWIIHGDVEGEGAVLRLIDELRLRLGRHA